ncbi:hypothetical protein ACROYT_G014038 [Oculina patagonica]
MLGSWDARATCWVGSPLLGAAMRLLFNRVPCSSRTLFSKNSFLEHIRQSLKAKLYGIAVLVCRGWQLVQSRRCTVQEHAVQKWPGNDIPIFRKNQTALKELNALVMELSESCSYAPAGFEAVVSKGDRKDMSDNKDQNNESLDSDEDANRSNCRNDEPGPQNTKVQIIDNLPFPLQQFPNTVRYKLVAIASMADCEEKSRARFQIMSVDGEHSEALDEGEERIENLKQEKAKDKSALTRAKNKLLYLLDGEDNPSRREVKQVCQQLCKVQERAMDTMEKLSQEYLRTKEIEKRKKVGDKMDKLEVEFSEAHYKAQEYLDNQIESAQIKMADAPSSGEEIVENRIETAISRGASLSEPVKVSISQKQKIIVNDGKYKANHEHKNLNSKTSVWDRIQDHPGQHLECVKGR